MDAVSTDPCDQHRYRVLGVGVDACRDVRAAAIGLHTRLGYSVFSKFGPYAGVDNSVCFEKLLNSDQ